MIVAIASRPIKEMRYEYLLAADQIFSHVRFLNGFRDGFSIDSFLIRTGAVIHNTFFG